MFIVGPPVAVVSADGWRHWGSLVASAPSTPPVGGAFSAGGRVQSAVCGADGRVPCGGVRLSSRARGCGFNGAVRGFSFQNGPKCDRHGPRSHINCVGPIKTTDQVPAEIVQIGIEDGSNLRPLFVVAKNLAVANYSDNFAGIRIDDIAVEHVFLFCVSDVTFTTPNSAHCSGSRRRDVRLAISGCRHKPCRSMGCRGVVDRWRRLAGGCLASRQRGPRGLVLQRVLLQGLALGYRGVTFAPRRRSFMWRRTRRSAWAQSAPTRAYPARVWRLFP